MFGHLIIHLSTSVHRTVMTAFKKVEVKQSCYRPGVARGFQKVKVHRFHDNDTGRWSGCQPYAPAAFTPRKYTCYSFLLEAESTPGPYCDRKDYVTEKFH